MIDACQHSAGCDNHFAPFPVIRHRHRGVRILKLSIRAGSPQFFGVFSIEGSNISVISQNRNRVNTTNYNSLTCTDFIAISNYYFTHYD